MSLFAELRRRNVFRVGIAYAVAAWLLLQIADVLIDNIGAPDWVFPTLLMVLGIGFPLALILAWAFELTPEGLKRESEVDRSASIAPQTGRRLDRVIIVALTLAVGYLLVDKLVLQERDAPERSAAGDVPATTDADGPSRTKASVAVLPFENMSDDPDNAYFSDGLTDTLLHMLAQLPDLQVAARTSSFAFRGDNKSVPEIAAALGVANVLEGSVQRAGDQVRVTAQLVRADDGFQVWSQNYTRPLQDIFAIQDEIAADVAGALGASLLGQERAVAGNVDTDNLTAYEAYLRGVEQEAIFTYTSLEEAERHYEQALALDPGFVDARLALARNYLKKRTTGMIDSEVLHERTRPLLDQVLADDPGNRQAQAYECVLTGRFNQGALRTREAAEAHVKRCRDLLALVPTETFVRASVAGGLSFVFDDHEGALELLRAGLLIDPLAPELHLEIGRISRVEGDLEAAERALLRAIELAPENPTAYGLMADIERERGRLPEALDWFRRAIDVDPQDPELPFELSMYFFGLELPEEGDRWFQRVQALAPGSAMARALQLERARRTDDDERALQIARAMIEDRVTTRGGVFYVAVLYYSDLMMRAGRSEEAHDFLLDQAPAIGDFGTLPETGHEQVMQQFVIALKSGFAPGEERLAAWESMLQAHRDLGRDALDNDNMKVWDLLIRGEVDTAADFYLEHRLAEPVAAALWRHRETLPALFGPMNADPRILAARAERSRAFDAERTAVLAMLEREDWAP